jgi:hypothetical protein
MGPPLDRPRPMSPFLTTGGVNPQRVPIVGRCCRRFPLREFAAPIDRLQRVETRRKCSGDLTTQERNSAQIKYRRSVSGAAQMGGGATRERDRLCLVRVGCDAASFSTSTFDAEPVVPVGAG